MIARRSMTKVKVMARIREGRFSRAENGKWTRRDHGGRLSKKVISVSVSHGVT